VKKTLALLLGFTLVGGLAYANFCARDYVPAATLLVPYAVVDLDATNQPDSNGYTTTLTVTNVSRVAQLIHVTVWDARSNPIVDFDEVLSGYDVWSINFRDLLNGRFDYFDTGTSRVGFFDNSGPSYDYNGIPGVDTGNPCPPWGPSSNCGYGGNLVPDDYDTANLSGCEFPYGDLSSLGPTITSNLQAVIRNYPQVNPCGTNDPSSAPYWQNITNRPVFFYVTVDTAVQCSLRFPNDTNYWTYDADFDNVLIGDILYMNSNANYSEMIPAVHIEADQDWTGRTFFQSRLLGGRDDRREPLATAFAFRYFNDPALGFSTDVIVWKNYHDRGFIAPNFFFYLADRGYIYYAWDEDEICKSRTGGPSGFASVEPNNLPLETQKVPFDQANWSGLPDKAGWVLLVFDPSIRKAALTPTQEYQAWVGVKYTFGNYSAGVDAATLGNYHCFASDVLPTLNALPGAPANGAIRGWNGLGQNP